MDACYPLAIARMGFWTSYQWHQQSRPYQHTSSRETVQTLWLGSSLQLPVTPSAWQADLDLAIPVWVHTTNTVLSGAFTTTKGFRSHVGLTYNLPDTVIASQIKATYSYRELGGETLGTWLWPKNRWQTASLGLSLAW